MDKEPQFEFSPSGLKARRCRVDEAQAGTVSWRVPTAVTIQFNKDLVPSADKDRTALGRPQSTWMTRPGPNKQQAEKISSEPETRELGPSRGPVRWSYSDPERVLLPCSGFGTEAGTQQLTACKRKVQCREGAKNRLCQWKGRLPSALTWSGGGPVQWLNRGCRG